MRAPALLAVAGPLLMTGVDPPGGLTLLPDQQDGNKKTKWMNTFWNTCTNKSCNCLLAPKSQRNS
eukprot:2650890-Amphidinium_carterae.1